MATYPESVGIKFNVTTGIDLTGYDTLELLVKLPDSTTVAWDLTITDLTAGTCYYTSTATDLLVKGVYLAQAHVIFDDDSEYYGNIDRFVLYQQLEVTA